MRLDHAATRSARPVGHLGRARELSAAADLHALHAGVPGMKVGGRRKLSIPSAMAYGARGAGGGVIEPHEPLIFVIDLLSVG